MGLLVRARRDCVNGTLATMRDHFVTKLGDIEWG